MPAAVAYAVAAILAVGSAVPADGRTHGETLEFRDSGAAVATLNAQLAAAGFHPDDGDRFGRKTRHAVYAFQKHHGLAVNGKFNPFMWDLLSEPIIVPHRRQPNRVEIDLGKQVLYVVRDRAVVLVLPISSGDGTPYIGSNGRRQIADTPEGVFEFERRIIGIRRAPLGTLYNPYYFRGGIAIHGSPSVPNYPASHGCVRVTMWDSELLVDYLELGQTVYVYGHTRAADMKKTGSGRFI